MIEEKARKKRRRKRRRKRKRKRSINKHKHENYEEDDGRGFMSNDIIEYENIIILLGNSWK